jgi:hypothetical protein
MQKEEVLKQFHEFLAEYNEQGKDSIWQEQSNIFKSFWEKKVLNYDIKELDDFELDGIIRIFDRNARGNTYETEAVARMMIPQGVWRKMFNQIHIDTKLTEHVDRVLKEVDPTQRAIAIDELYAYNEPHKNSLTGKSGNAINAFLFINSPKDHISVVSLKDREKIIKFFGFKNGPDFENDSPGTKIVQSDLAISEGFKSYFGSQYSPRTICVFLYHSPVRDIWRAEEIKDDDAPWGGWGQSTSHLAPHEMKTREDITDPSLFYMESQLEDFLIENWDRTELGQKYDLIEEDGEVVSQQYRTKIGVIDILAQDKKTNQLVVIELKKNQTSDDTIGQLARYMGWLETNITKGKATKGIIIAAQYDERLYYALQIMKGVEIYLYRVNFRLEEFKDTRKQL